MTFRQTLCPLLALAIPLLQACEQAEKPVAAQSVIASTSSSMSVRVEISGETFVLTNLANTKIDNLQLTTYPDPLANHILLLPYSFKKVIGTLEKHTSVTVSFGELTNGKNARLSDSPRRRVGACHIGGKIQGQPVGQLFVREGDRFVRTDPGTKWGGVEEPILGPVDDAKKAELEVEVSTTAIMDPLVVVVVNKGKLIRNLAIAAYPPPADGHTLNPSAGYTSVIERVSPGETVTLIAEQFRSTSGHELSNAVRIGVLHLQGDVSGKRTERFVTRITDEPPQ